jgi:hypothetical protein
MRIAIIGNSGGGRLTQDEEGRGKQVFRLATLEELNSFAPSALGSP